MRRDSRRIQETLRAGAPPFLAQINFATLSTPLVADAALRLKVPFRVQIWESEL
jgi:hypothetical protein